MQTDPLYGVEFPKTLRPSQSLPAAVEYGTVTLEGFVVAIGNDPFIQTALRVENNGGFYYYILSETENLPEGSNPVALRGDLVLIPRYFIDNTLAAIEYHLMNITVSVD